MKFFWQRPSNIAMNLESPMSPRLMKQDSLPRRPRRGNSPERICTRRKSGEQIGRISRADSVSDLSSSHESCESVCSFLSYDDSTPSFSTTPNSSQSSSSRKFSTTSRLSLFSSQRPEKKNRRGRKKSQQPQQQQQQEEVTLNRWDSWKECTPKGSPVKPERKGVVALPPMLCAVPLQDSRWTSHSSSRAPVASPRRSSSPKRISPTQQQQQQQKQEDIVFHPQSTPRQRPALQHRAVLTRRPKARNLWMEAVPNHHHHRLPRALTTLLTEHDHETIRKLKSTWESKRSIVTTSTRDSGASSTASPDYSIPWFSSSLQHRPAVYK